MTYMNFGTALAVMKSTGGKAARRGWNGKNMYIFLHVFQEHERSYEPCIVMFTAQGLYQPGWLASQNDMLAEDWEIVQ